MRFVGRLDTRELRVRTDGDWVPVPDQKVWLFEDGSGDLVISADPPLKALADAVAYRWRARPDWSLADQVVAAVRAYDAVCAFRQPPHSGGWFVAGMLQGPGESL